MKDIIIWLEPYILDNDSRLRSQSRCREFNDCSQEVQILEMVGGGECSSKIYLKNDQIGSQYLKLRKRCSTVLGALWQRTHVFVAFWKLQPFLNRLVRVRILSLHTS